MVSRVADDGDDLALCYTITGADFKSAVVHVDGQLVAGVLHDECVSTASCKSGKQNSSIALR